MYTGRMMDIRTMPKSDLLYLLVQAVVALGTAVVIMAGIFMVLEFCIMWKQKSQLRARRLDGDQYFKDRLK